MAVMIDLGGSSVNTENLLRICSGPANRLKETVHKMLSPMEIEPGPLIASDSKSNSLLSTLT